MVAPERKSIGNHKTGGQKSMEKLRQQRKAANCSKPGLSSLEVE
jgi:hypothetical protein